MMQSHHILSESLQHQKKYFDKKLQLTTNSKYHKVPKFLDTKNICYNVPKIHTKRPNLKGILSKDANGIANSEDPDQTAPLGAV